MKVSEQEKKCAHPSCNCAATVGDYCSEQCRRNAAVGQTDCNCGHSDCA